MAAMSLLDPSAASPLAAAMPAGVVRLAADGMVGDSELVRRTLEGEADAFSALVARHQKRAFWIAFHLVGRAEDARDVTQEAFLRLHRCLHQYDFARSFSTWFHRILTNLAIDHLRKHRHAAGVASLEDIPGGIADEREAGIAVWERAERGALVQKVLDALDPRFRAVLVMRDLQGMAGPEIAPILGITHSTVRWRLHRARQMFQAHWERLERGGSA